MLDDLKEEGIVNKVGGRFKLSTLIQKRMRMLNTGARARRNAQPGQDVGRHPGNPAGHDLSRQLRPGPDARHDRGRHRPPRHARRHLVGLGRRRRLEKWPVASSLQREFATGNRQLATRVRDPQCRRGRPGSPRSRACLRADAAGGAPPDGPAGDELSVPAARATLEVNTESGNERGVLLPQGGLVITGV